MSELTVPVVDGDWSAWHGGRRWAAVWVALLDGPASDVVARARELLVGAGLVRPDYARQPHVTVAFRGLVAEAGTPGATVIDAPGVTLTGYDDESVARDVAQIAALCAGPVTLRAAAWDSFPMVPYLGLDADPWLLAAHRLLADDDPGFRFIPHLTLGQYRVTTPIADVVALLGALPVPDATWTVRELALVRYRADELAGPLQRVGSLDLTTGRWRSVRSITR